MHYHCRPLKYVEYGKIYPYRHKDEDNWINLCYDWLGKHCGYSPQIWLSRSTSYITGCEENHTNILFGFSYIKGFPVDYDMWCLIMNDIMNNKELIELFDWCSKDEDHYPFQETWEKTRSVDEVLKKHLFVENNQTVVPSLNLKSAKTITCKDEKQKKALRKMGFIEDRITIRSK